MEISVQPNTGYCLSGSVENFRPFFFLTSTDWCPGDSPWDPLRARRARPKPRAPERTLSSIYSGTQPSQVPWGHGVWCAGVWGGGTNPNMFCLVLWYNASSIALPTPWSLCTLLPFSLPLHSVTRCEVAYLRSETEPYTEEISYTWVDKFSTDVKSPLTTVPGVLELPKRGPYHRGPSEEGKQIKAKGGEWRGEEFGRFQTPGTVGQLTADSSWDGGASLGVNSELMIVCWWHFSRSPNWFISWLGPGCSFLALLLWPLLRAPEFLVIPSLQSPKHLCQK